MEGSERSDALPTRLSGWLLGLYAWIVALAFGAMLIDSVYASSLAGSESVGAVAVALHEAADFQQLPMALAVIAGIATLVMVVQRPMPRYLISVSLALTLAPLPVIMLFGDLIADAGEGAGTGIRLALGAGASLSAMAAAVLPARAGRH